jgi:hypothetical protein
MSVPFAERGGRLRGGIDLLAGRLPRFIFGGGAGGLLPVFHFHDEVRSDLDPKLRYLADNGYRTVTADDIGRYIRRQAPLPDRAVALCFDDAWASVWTMAAPLLEQYGFRAIVYAIPGRTDDADGVRPQDATIPNGSSPLMTWPELRALHSRGTIDVQSHTFSHAQIDTADTVTGFIDRGYDATPLFSRPLQQPHDSHHGQRSRPTFATPGDLGLPLYPTRSAMSDAPRVVHDAEARTACLRLARQEGFFDVPHWRARLDAVVAKARPGAVETDSEQTARIERELDDSRSEINARLGADVVRHVCLPWGVSGARTEAALGRLGFSTAVANRMPGMFAVRPGDHPFWLKRLPNRYIYRLPGRGRRWWFVAQ